VHLHPILPPSIGGDCAYTDNPCLCESGSSTSVPAYSTVWELIQYSSVDGSCTRVTLDDHTGMNATCYQSSGTKVRFPYFTIFVSTSGTALKYAFLGSKSGPDSFRYCETLNIPAVDLFPTECTRGSNLEFGPYNTDFKILPASPQTSVQAAIVS